MRRALLIASMKVTARYPVQRYHVERGRGGPLLDEAADVEAIRIRTSMHDVMNRTAESVNAKITSTESVKSSANCVSFMPADDLSAGSMP